MWLMAIGIALAGLAILTFSFRGWHSARHLELGFMSQQWLAEHQASSRS